MKTQNANVAIVNFSRAKTVVAVAMTPKQDALFVMGQELGDATAETTIAWADALKAVKTPADRAILRRGFVSTYAATMRTDEKSAGNRFDYLARKFAAPETSRQRKATAKRKAGGGRKAKVATGDNETLAASAIAQRMAAALHYIAAAQQKHMGDDEMLEVLGEIAGILGGAKKAAK